MSGDRMSNIYNDTKEGHLSYLHCKFFLGDKLTNFSQQENTCVMQNYLGLCHSLIPVLRDNSPWAPNDSAHLVIKILMTFSSGISSQR